VPLFRSFLSLPRHRPERTTWCRPFALPPRLSTPPSPCLPDESAVRQGRCRSQVEGADFGSEDQAASGQGVSASPSQYLRFLHLLTSFPHSGRLAIRGRSRSRYSCYSHLRRSQRRSRTSILQRRPCVVFPLRNRSRRFLRH
jgi:hypothetical protein